MNTPQYVSVRISHEKNTGHNHDFRLGKNPDFIVAEKTKDNRLIASDHQAEISSPYNFFKNLVNRAKRSIKRLSESLAGRKWQENSPLFIHGIITFGEEASKSGKLERKEDLDSCAMEFIKKFREKHNFRDDALIYLVRHEDETTPHYHFNLINQNKDGKSVRSEFNNVPYSAEERKENPELPNWKEDKTAEIQDLAGEAFAPMGFVRGMKKEKREELEGEKIKHQTVKEYRQKTIKVRKAVEKNRQTILTKNEQLKAKAEQLREKQKEILEREKIVNDLTDEKIDKITKRISTYYFRAIEHFGTEQGQKNIDLIVKSSQDLGLKVKASKILEPIEIEPEKQDTAAKARAEIDRLLEEREKAKSPVKPKSKSKYKRL